MDTEKLIILSLALICIAIGLGYKVLIEYVSGKVFENSVRIQSLVEINQKYSFRGGFSTGGNYTRSLPSKRAFDTFRLENLMRQAIEDNPEHFERIMENISYNKALYEKYHFEITGIRVDDKEAVKTAAQIGIPLNIYQSIENRLYEEWKLKPVREVRFVCKKTYTSPKGRNSYNSHAIYGYNDVARLYRIVHNNRTTKADIAFERAMVTDSMRYDIMKRDGFRCQLCGRSREDGVKLQVDHIKPVSKGGKTVRSNLRTLCEQCNKGKSNKYDPDGLN